MVLRGLKFVSSQSIPVTGHQAEEAWKKFKSENGFTNAHMSMSLKPMTPAVCEDENGKSRRARLCQGRAGTGSEAYPRGSDLDRGDRGATRSIQHA